LFELEKRGSLSWWLHNQQPFGIDLSSPPHHTSKYEIEEIRRFNLGHILAHGILDINSNSGTYFSFCGVSQSNIQRRHIESLRLITPVLNDLFLAYIRTERRPLASLHQEMSIRQREIVRLVLAGLDNKAIATELGTAHQTIKNSLVEIYGILNVKNRKELYSLLR
jgi:DNA-binding CsgD family transcriptional regulator